MTAHHPQRAVGRGRGGAANGVGVRDGGVLHPAYVLDIIDVAVAIDRRCGNRELIRVGQRDTKLQSVSDAGL